MGSHNFMATALGSCVKWPLYMYVYDDLFAPRKDKLAEENDESSIYKSICVQLDLPFPLFPHLEADHLDTY